MKRLVCTVCSVLLCVGLLSGCGTSLEGEESVVYVGKKGVIESLMWSRSISPTTMRRN